MLKFLLIIFVCAILIVMVALFERSKELEISRLVCAFNISSASEYARASFKEVKLLNPRAKIFLPLEMDAALIIVGPNPLCPS